MARKPGLARQPVALHCNSGACAVTPALVDDETWPELRCSDAWQCWGMLPCLPVQVQPLPASRPGHLTARHAAPIPEAPSWFLPSKSPVSFPPLRVRLCAAGGA